MNNRLQKKGAGGGMGPMMMIGLVLILVMVAMLCEEQKKNKKLEDENKNLKEEIEKLKQQNVIQPPVPIIAKNNTEEANFSSSSEPPSISSTGYPITYVGGDETKTCAFQKGNNCGNDKYCPNDQWIKSSDAKTCCKNVCIARVQHKDVDFGAPLGKATVEKFSGNRFGVWYGSGAGEGFIEIGKPNYVEAKNVGGEKYEFGVSSKKYAFTVQVNEASKIEIVANAMPTTTKSDFNSCTADNECISVKADCCGCTQDGKAIAINKNKQSEYMASLQCSGVICTQAISTDSSCSAILKCTANKCTLSADTVALSFVDVSIQNFAYNPKTL